MSSIIVKMVACNVGTWLVVFALALTAADVGVAAAKMKYNTAGGPVPGKLNVHLVPHTHDGRARRECQFIECRFEL